MGTYRRDLADMYIRKEYRSFITEVYKNKDWRLFPDADIHRIADEYVEDRVTNLLFTPNHFDGESTWDENTGRLRLNRDYNTGTYCQHYCYMQIFTNVLPRYCEDGKMCFYAEYDYCSDVDETVIYDLKNKRQAKVDYILEKLCDDINDYEKLSDNWTDIDDIWYTRPISYTIDEDILTERFIIKNDDSLKRATKEELEKLSEQDECIKATDLDALIDENGTLYIHDQIKTIYPYTFKNCARIRRVISENKFLQIGKYAFAGCINLEEVIFPDKPKDFQFISAYDTLVTINEGAFSGCLKLKRIQLPKWLNSIDPFMFFGCVSLEEVLMPASTEERVKLARSRGIEIDPADLVLCNIYSAPCHIHSHTFSLCRSLKKLALPDTLRTIGDEAFSHCTSLEEISLPSTLRKIGNGAFRGCTSFRQIDIPCKTCEIGEGAFNDCTELSEIILPPSVDIIGGSKYDEKGIISALSGHILHHTMLGKDKFGFHEYQFTPLDGVTIKCTENSAAEFYARYNKFRFELITMGDK